MTTQRSLLGKEGESLVAEHLRREGFTIVAQNYMRSYGEVDLIAQKKELLVFVEVKTRRGIPLFDMTELITCSKQRKIIAVAKQFLAQHTNNDVACRFDVALVVQTEKETELCYIADAFQENI